MVYGAAHVLAQSPAHGVEALRVVQFDHCNTSLCVDAKVNECAKICASPLATPAQPMRLYRRCSLFLLDWLSPTDLYDHLAKICTTLQEPQRRLYRALFERKGLK